MFKVGRRVAKEFLTTLADRAIWIGLCPFFQRILDKFCASPQLSPSARCYISALSRVEFLRATISNVVARDDYFKWTSVQQYQGLDDLFDEKFVELVNFLKQLYSIDVAPVESEDVKLAIKFAEMWSKDKDLIKRVAFDMLLLAQAFRRGVKLFTRDGKLFEIREKILQPPPPKPRNVGGVKITYDDPYVLYVAYLA